MSSVWNISEKMPPGEYKKMLLAVLDYLGKESKEGSSSSSSGKTEEKSSVRLFIDGEFDGNQTKFESQSNNLEIGVIARTDTEGYILLLFLRIIVDSNHWFAWVNLRDELESSGAQNTNMTIESVVKNLAKVETQYTDIFAADSAEVSRELRNYRGKYTIVKETADINMWSLARIRGSIEDLVITKEGR
jgi:hypothetical protein